METKTETARIQSLMTLYDFHTTFLISALDGISDKDAHNRLNTKANHVAWFAGTLVQQRFEIAKMFGKDMKQKAHELFKDNKGIQDDVTYPPLDDFKADWKTISPVSRQALLNVSDEKLDSPFEMPEMKMNYYEFIAFMIYREANCIGQIALWRRLLGYKAMSYM